jgi:pyruvate carboxylase
MDIFRVFDALNDPEQLEVGIKAVLEAGGIAEGTLCYSGDSKLKFFPSFFSLYAAQ